MTKLWEIAMSETFPLDLGRTPKKVHAAYKGWVLAILKSAPSTSDEPKVKKLHGWKDLWRLRVSDEYRLVYRIDQRRAMVICLLLGNRKDVYDRLGATEDGSPGIRIVSNAPELLEREPTPEEIGRARHVEAMSIGPASALPAELLPCPVTMNLLESWGIPSDSHCQLLGIETFEALIASNVSDAIKERVLEAIYPRSIEEVAQLPVRVPREVDDVIAAAQGERSLTDFLLALDDEQQAYVQRFRIDQPTGPWLLKGCPGSGKSTVALYCAGAIVDTAAREQHQTREPIRILFTTYTNALTRSSELLLNSIRELSGGGTIEVRTVDSLANRLAGPEWTNRRVVKEDELSTYVMTALVALNAVQADFPFNREDAEFLKEEIEWVILGQAVEKADDYLQADRGGRGRRLGHLQQRALWTVWEHVRNSMNDDGCCLFAQKLMAASRTAAPVYDYVFVDEAQDLKPIAIRFCLKLAKERANLFLAADSNQSIYGAAMSWKRVAGDLSFSGRARILRRNYRTTKEMWPAVLQIAATVDAETDAETLAGESVMNGELPTLFWYESETEAIGRLQRYIDVSIVAERVSRDAVAVLCRTNRECERIASRLGAHLNAKAMKSRDLELQHPGVKVLTMHASKGLQFPVVVVLVPGDRMLPVNSEDAAARVALESRILFVACTRAARRLLVCASAAAPARALAHVTDTYWEVEGT
jgi:mRNA-degrading endonuclease RelE of RelBE toxin-antitoxin system